MRVEEAFVRAVSRSRVREAHGRWIPVDYWIEKLIHVLLEQTDDEYGITKMKPKQLITKLEKRGYLDRDFSSDEDTFGNVKRIHCNNKKLRVSGSSKERTVYFLFLEAKEQPPSKSTLPMWQEYYDSFMTRRQTHQFRIERRQHQQGATTNSIMDAVAEEDQQSSHARPVTPTIELDKDITALLEPFFTGDLNISFKGDNGGLRKVIKAFGCKLQQEDNKLVAQAKKADEDINSLKAINSHRAFLDRYCCPPWKSCIQSFIALAMKIDEEDPAVDIFQLKKHGGSKGSGTKLAPLYRQWQQSQCITNAMQSSGFLVCWMHLLLLPTSTDIMLASSFVKHWRGWSQRQSMMCGEQLQRSKRWTYTGK
jgi:hypothetical protein